MPNNCGHESQIFLIIKEQLNFFASVARDRNYLWKKELSAQFEKSFLFRNIWNQYPIDQMYLELQSCFCKIAMSLYVDQPPLSREKISNLFVFVNVDKKEKLNVFMGVEGVNYQEINTFFTLLDNLVKYLDEINAKIDLQFIVADNVTLNNQHILGTELVQNTVQMLEVLLRLNLPRII